MSLQLLQSFLSSNYARMSIQFSTFLFKLSKKLFAGRCPFIMNSSVHSVIYYNISTTEPLTVLIQCHSNHLEHILVCELDGQWNLNSSDVCYMPSTKTSTCKLSASFYTLSITYVLIYLHK